MNPDFECTWWPDVWFGVSLTDCCAAHDVSSLDAASSIDLGVCAVRALAGTHPVAGLVVGSAMALGTFVWCALKYGPGGIRRR